MKAEDLRVIPDNNLKAKDFRKIARDSLKGKWGKAVLIFVAYMLIAYFIGVAIGIFATTPFAILGFIVDILIFPPIGFSLMAQYLKLSNNEQFQIFSFIDWTNINFTKCWKVILHIIKKLIIPIILIIIFAIIAVFSTTAGVLELFEDETSFSSFIFNIGFVTISWLGYIVTIIYTAIKSYLYILTPYLIVDKPDFCAMDIVEQSQLLMKGQIWKLLCLALSFIGWAILSVFTFGIGMLFLFPYMQMSFVAFYKNRAGLLEKTEE